MLKFAPNSPDRVWASLFAGSLGLLMMLALTKFGNPVILADKIPAPTTLQEFIIQPWPPAWGYGLLALAALCGLRFWRWQSAAPWWIVVLPAVWLAWQFLSATQTVDSRLTSITVIHFSACAVCFYIGLFALSRVPNVSLALFWLGLFGGFFVVMAVGWEQHLGGLQRSREYFYSLPDWRSYPPEFIKKVASNRIYGTLFYPNALAGVVILLLPATLSGLWRWTSEWPAALRVGVSGTIGVLALGCLYWSGSKAGWLIALVQALFAFLNSPLRGRSKAGIAVLILAVGLAGFWFKYQSYFERGATSTSARLEYWRAAWQIFNANPVLGTGPGTFMASYKQIKSPESEMARLAHNDFLQQASDSGLPGFLAYGVFVWLSLALLWRRCAVVSSVFCGIWLGLAGLAAQGLVEFGLYLPAVAWSFFLLMGWLWGVCLPVDSNRQCPQS